LAEYLFPVVGGPLEDLQAPVEDNRIAKVMKASGHKMLLSRKTMVSMKNDTFLSFHCQAGRPLSREALLAGYLSAWLKRCVIPSPPHDAITPLVIFPAIQLV